MQQYYYSKKFALAKDKNSIPEKGILYLVEKISKNQAYPHRIWLSEQDFELSSTSSNNIQFIKISSRIKQRWVLNKLISSLMSVSEYKLYLEKQKSKSNGFIQTSITDFRLSDCKSSHRRVIHIDLHICANCRMSKCVNCQTEIIGLMHDLAKHFGLELFELNYLFQTYSAQNYPGTDPICIEKRICKNDECTRMISIGRKECFKCFLGEKIGESAENKASNTAASKIGGTQ